MFDIRNGFIATGTLDKIAIWNLNGGDLVGFFQLPRSWNEPMATPRIRVVIKYPFVGLGIGTGHFHIFKDNGNDFKLLASLKDEDVTTHGFTYAPLTFILGNHFVLTNGAFPDELTCWKLDQESMGPFLNAYREDQGALNSVRENPENAKQKKQIHANETRDQVNGKTTSKTENPKEKQLNLYNLKSWDDLDVLDKEDMPLDPRVLPESYALSEVKAFERQYLVVPPFRDVQRADLVQDDTMLVTCTFQPTDEFDQSLLVWDFRVDRPKDRFIEKVAVNGKIVWVCYEAK